METTLRLSDVLARNVAMEWFEAVAIVREVADRIDDPHGRPGVPELDQVLISPDGAISLGGTARKDEPVRRIGQLLLACLVQSDPPVQLRLVASQAMMSEPAFSTIREFSDALAYFERPDRTAVIRQLFARAQTMPSSPIVETPTLDLMVPLQIEREREHDDKSAAPRRPVPRRGVAALAAGVVLVVATTTYTQLRGGGPTQADVSAIAVKATDAVGSTLVKGLSAVSETVGLGRIVPAEGSPGSVPAPAPPESSAPAGARSARTGTPAASAGSSFRLFDLEAVPVSVGVPVAMPAIREETLSSNGPAAAPADAPDVTVYSAADPAITPPVGVRPQLPRVLPEDISKDRLSQIELVVLPDGTVGSVKLIGEQRSVLEGMLLSAAKAWKFRPAEKDGRPVAYRKTVWLVRE